MTRLMNRSGKMFGQLKALYRGPDYKTPRGKSYTRWVCQCRCGVKTLVQTENLTTGNSTTCGCHRGDNVTPWARTPVFFDL